MERLWHWSIPRGVVKMFDWPLCWRVFCALRKWYWSFPRGIALIPNWIVKKNKWHWSIFREIDLFPSLMRPPITAITYCLAWFFHIFYFKYTVNLQANVVRCNIQFTLCPVHTGNDILIAHTNIVENQQESICAETGRLRGGDKAYLLLFPLLLEEWEWRRTSFTKNALRWRDFQTQQSQVS